MTKSAAKELGARGITVNAVAPGFVDTDMTQNLPDEIKEGAKNKSPSVVLAGRRKLPILLPFSHPIPLPM